MIRLYVDITEEEVAKLHALGGSSWVRLQVQNAPAPTGIRGLSAAERQALLDDLPRLGRAATAFKYRVKPTSIDWLRRGANVTFDLRRRDARPQPSQAAA